MEKNKSFQVINMICCHATVKNTSLITMVQSKAGGNASWFTNWQQSIINPLD